MNNDTILEQIDQQIAQLQQARALLTNGASDESSKRGRGRPKGSSKKTASAAEVPEKLNRRVMTQEGKARIAAAQKARWAAVKKANQTAKPAPKKSAKKTKSVTKKSAPARKTAPVVVQPDAEAAASDA